jgi:hypothetical protein
MKQKESIIAVPIDIQLIESEFVLLIEMLDNYVVRNSRIKKNNQVISSDFYFHKKKSGDDMTDFTLDPSQKAYDALPLLGRLIEQYEKHCTKIDSESILMPTKEAVK